MSIENRIGNLFDQSDINLIIQQCNIHHTMGGGIAKIIRETYPYAYEADLKTKKGDESKVGTFSVGKPADGNVSPKTPIFVNMYSQAGYGNPNRDTKYDAMVDALREIEKRLAPKADKYIVGIPYSIGCGLANGDWNIVKAILGTVFAKSPVKVVIVRLPNQPLLGDDKDVVVAVVDSKQLPAPDLDDKTKSNTKDLETF